MAQKLGKPWNDMIQRKINGTSSAAWRSLVITLAAVSYKVRRSHFTKYRFVCLTSRFHTSNTWTHSEAALYSTQGLFMSSEESATKVWSCARPRRMTPSPVGGAPCPSWSHVEPTWVSPASIVAFTPWVAGMRRWARFRQWRSTVQRR